MGKWGYFVLLLLCLVIGACVKHTSDQYLPVPELASEQVVIKRVIVFPFTTDNTVPKGFLDDLYRSFVRYLIEKCGFFVVHPDVAKECMSADKMLTREKMVDIAYKLGVEGFVVGFLSDFKRQPLRIAVDVGLYPVVGDEKMVKHGFLVYDASDKRLIVKMKRYANMFEWVKLPLGWERVVIKPDIFSDFVAWDVVNSIFVKETG